MECIQACPAGCLKTTKMELYVIQNCIHFVCWATIDALGGLLYSQFLFQICMNEYCGFRKMLHAGKYVCVIPERISLEGKHTV